MELQSDDKSYPTQSPITILTKKITSLDFKEQFETQNISLYPFWELNNSV